MAENCNFWLIEYLNRIWYILILCSAVLRGLIVYDHGHEVTEGVFVANGAMLGAN
jgi:hypothetical protein